MIIEPGAAPGVVASEWWQELLNLQPGRDLDLDLAAKMLPRTDLDSANAIIDRYPDQISYGHQSRQWYFWDGTVHRVVRSTEITDIVTAYVVAVRSALQLVEDQVRSRADADPNRAKDVDKDFIAAWGKHLRYRDRICDEKGARAISDMLARQVTVDETEFDVDPRWLVCENAVIDLDQVVRDEIIVTVEHDPRRRVTKQLGASYDADEPQSLWQQYIERTLPNHAMRTYLWKAAGAALLGDPRHKAVFNLIGIGDTGKSVFIDALLACFGDYGQMVPAKVFLAKRGDGDFAQHQLKGARFVAASEPGGDKRLDDGFLKALTGRDVQNTAAKYQQEVSWKPMCTVFIASNFPTEFDTTDEAFLTRIKPIPFTVKFSDASDAPITVRMDRSLETKLKQHHLTEILNWLLEGLLLYLQEGLAEPTEVASARDDMQVEIEPALRWVRDTVELGDLREVDPGSVPRNHTAEIKSLHQAYLRDERNAGVHHTLTQQHFSRVLQTKYGAKVNSGNWRIPGLVWVKQGRSDAPF